MCVVAGTLFISSQKADMSCLGSMVVCETGKHYDAELVLLYCHCILVF